MKAVKHLVIVFIFLSFCVSTIMADTQKPVAEPMFGSFGLSWSLNVPYSKLVLKVATPSKEVVTLTFGAGQVPGFDLSSLPSPVLDGAYKYELLIVPVLPSMKVRKGEKLGFEDKFNAAYQAHTHTGHFTVMGGSIVNPNLNESPSGVNGQTIATDLIVQGSECVGLDCVNGESFGYDTIRLKENNTRIKFDDTSTSSSFPNTDWQLTANDQINGGANKFSIDDTTHGTTPFTIEAASSNNTLYVDSAKRIGINTNSPVFGIHMVQGNSPTLRLEQDTSNGFSAQTWDVGGNETNFFVRDATHSSTLPFKIYPSAPDNSIKIESDGVSIKKIKGNLGIGTDSPDYQVHISQDGSAATFMIERSDGTPVQTMIKSSGTNGIIGTKSNHDLYFNANNTGRMSLKTTGRLEMQVGGGYYDQSNGDWINGSSRQYKEDIQSLSAKDAIDTVEQLEPVTFKFKIAEKGDRQVGFIAEDVPELVAKKDRKGLSPMDIVAVLTKVVQEQQKTIKQLQKDIKELKDKK